MTAPTPRTVEHSPEHEAMKAHPMLYSGRSGPDLSCPVCHEVYIVTGDTEDARRTALAHWKGCCITGPTAPPWAKGDPSETVTHLAITTDPSVAAAGESAATEGTNVAAGLGAAAAPASAAVRAPAVQPTPVEHPSRRTAADTPALIGGRLTFRTIGCLAVLGWAPVLGVAWLAWVIWRGLS